VEINELLVECYHLKDEIMKSTEYQNLLLSEKEMLCDSYVQLLIQYFQTAQSFYNDALRLNMESKDEFSFKFSQAKTVLYTHEKVKNYLANLERFNRVLDLVSSSIFGALQLTDERLTVQYRSQGLKLTEE
jgi:cell fate (sporulation/competence/biofilm development) regulator YlbF (YheA/YmcA/DUF963 family)